MDAEDVYAVDAVAVDVVAVDVDVHVDAMDVDVDHGAHVHAGQRLYMRPPQRVQEPPQ